MSVVKLRAMLFVSDQHHTSAHEIGRRSFFIRQVAWGRRGVLWRDNYLFSSLADRTKELFPSLPELRNFVFALIFSEDSYATSPIALAREGKLLSASTVKCLTLFFENFRSFMSVCVFTYLVDVKFMHIYISSYYITRNVLFSASF